MKTFRRASERGHANYGWLDTNHTFSFANYYDPDQMGFSVLRVINEDRIRGGTGFGTHGHNDMEIISYVVEGALEHKDTMGNSTVIYPGEVQTMSAGTGVEHSEYNHSKDDVGHFYQIWILPDRKGHKPGYGQKSFASLLDKNELVLVVSGDGSQQSIQIHQDIKMYAGRFKKSQKVKLPLANDRAGWLQMVTGHVSLAGDKLMTSDGVAITQENDPVIEIKDDSEILFFDLPQ